MSWIIRPFEKVSRNIRKSHDVVFVNNVVGNGRDFIGFATSTLQEDQLILFLFASRETLYYYCSDWPTIPQLYVNGEFIGGKQNI